MSARRDKSLGHPKPRDTLKEHWPCATPAAFTVAPTTGSASAGVTIAPTRNAGTATTSRRSLDMTTTELRPKTEAAIDKIVRTITRNVPMPSDDKEALRQALRDLVIATNTTI